MKARNFYRFAIVCILCLIGISPIVSIECLAKSNEGVDDFALWLNPGTEETSLVEMQEGTDVHGVFRYPCPSDDYYLPACKENLFPACIEANPPIALTTDYYVSLMATLYASADGDNWRWIWRDPSGNIARSVTVTYYENYDGQQDCWVLPWPWSTVCDWPYPFGIGWGSSIIRDGTPGVWHMELNYNGEQVHSQPFDLVFPPQAKIEGFTYDDGLAIDGTLGVEINLVASPEDTGPWNTLVRVGTSPDTLSVGEEFELIAGTQDIEINFEDHGLGRFDSDVIITVATETPNNNEEYACVPLIPETTTLAIPLPVLFVHGYLKYSMGVRPFRELVFSKYISPEQANPLFEALEFFSQFSFTTSDWRLPYSRVTPYQTLIVFNWISYQDWSPEDLAVLLEIRINEALQGVYASRANIISHSAGGLLARDFVRRSTGWPSGSPVKKLIMVGCPNNGASKTYLEMNGFVLSDTERLMEQFAGFLIPLTDGDLFQTRGPYLKSDPCVLMSSPPLTSTFISVSPPPYVEVFNIFTRGKAGNTPWDLLASPHKDWFRFSERQLNKAKGCNDLIDWEGLRTGDGTVAVNDARLGYGDIEVATTTSHLHLLNDGDIRLEIIRALGMIE